MGLTTRKNYRLFLSVNTFVIVLLGAGLAGWGVIWSFPVSLGEGYHNVQSVVQEVGKILFWRVVVLYAVISLLIVLSMIGFHLLYSHRIAGPTYRIGLEAARIAQGNLNGNITFRRKDNLTDMADSLNDVASQYRGRIDAVKACLALIEARSKTVSNLIQQERDGATLKQASEEMMSAINNLERNLLEMRI